MYCKYAWNAGATAANVLADITAILTGTTDKTGLSASCDQTNTNIISTIAAGWELYDDTAGTNRKCVRTAIHDDVTNYLYVTVDTNTANKILIAAFESWNASTNTGTNQVASSDTNNYITVALASAGYVLFFATPKGLGFTTSAGGTGVGNCVFFCQRTRKSAWDTVANGYPPIAAWWSRGANLYLIAGIRALSNTGSDLVGTGIVMDLLSPCFRMVYNVAGLSGVTPSTAFPDANKTKKYGLFDISITGSTGSSATATIGNVGGSVSELNDIWFLGTIAATHEISEIICNGKTYVVWVLGNTKYAIRKG